MILKKIPQSLVLVVILLILTNLLTYLKVDNWSKKERKQYNKTIDSLKRSNINLQSLIIIEKNKRQELSLRDSIIIHDIKELNKKDKELINKQKNIINKYKNLSNDELIHVIDSLYKLEN